MAKKYIDADLLRAEIEKRLKNVRDYMNGAGMRYKGPKYYKAQGKESAYDALLNVIDSLQQEQPEVDLKNEIITQWSKCNPTDERMGSEYAIIAVEQFAAIARHFWNKGYNARKEENK